MAHVGFLHAEGGQALLSHPLFRTRDIDEARSQVAKVLCSHELRLAPTANALDARMFHFSIGRVSINRLDFGASVDVERDSIEDFYVVHMPISGTAEVCSGNDTVTSHPRLASVVAPTRPMRIRWHQGCDQIMIRIDRGLLDRHCAQHLGHELSRPVDFRLGMEIESRRLGAWRHLMEMLLAGVDGENGMFDSPLARPLLEQMVVGNLLFSQPNNYSDELRRPAPPIAPSHVKRAEEYIRANADKPITSIELARHAGVSTSALYAAFQNFRGVSPMAFLKLVRLERVRCELLAETEQHKTVTAAAMRWGFSHMGHFTADYKRKFGETPSQTLRRGF